MEMQKYNEARQGTAGGFWRHPDYNHACGNSIRMPRFVVVQYATFVLYKCSASALVPKQAQTLTRLSWLPTRHYNPPIASPSNKLILDIMEDRMTEDCPHTADSLPQTQRGAPRLAYRISELADATGLSGWFVRREIQSGKLRARKFGSAVLVLHDDAVEWLDSHPLVIQENADMGVSA